MRAQDINFDSFITYGGKKKAALFFKMFIFEYLSIKYSNLSFVKKIEKHPNCPKGGYDIKIIQTDGFVLGYKAKFFLDKIHIESIEKSYKAFIQENNSTKDFKEAIDKYFLCFPIDMSSEELRWWNKWKKSDDIDDKVIIESLTLSDFKKELMQPQYNDLCKKYFKSGSISYIS